MHIGALTKPRFHKNKQNQLASSITATLIFFTTLQQASNGGHNNSFNLPVFGNSSTDYGCSTGEVNTPHPPPHTHVCSCRAATCFNFCNIYNSANTITTSVINHQLTWMWRIVSLRGPIEWIPQPEGTNKNLAYVAHTHTYTYKHTNTQTQSHRQ